MMSVSPQQARLELDKLIKGGGSGYAALSRMIGRNDAYLQQYIKRGVPESLAERDRRMLANFFGVDEKLIDGGGHAPSGGPVLMMVPKLDVEASAGPGAAPGLEATLGHYGFDRQWLQRISSGRPETLSIVRVRGDSMAPTLIDGDDILVERSGGSVKLRDGIYVLQRDDALLVKRVTLTPNPGRLHIASDNPAYPSWPDCGAADVQIIGRVVWSGRRHI